MIDLRELLKKYIERVQIEEGTTFIPLRYGDRMDPGWWQVISREEWELLNDLRSEVRGKVEVR
jgi:hypothetical protein